MKTDPTPETNSRAAWWLLAGLGLFIIALLGVLLNYRTLRATYLLPPATLTYTASPTETPTPVPTETRTPRPTWTLSPSKTPTITPTETGTATPTRPSVPTLTPALPYKFNDRYDLEAPSPELAQRITILMRQLPDLLYDTPEERQAPAYHQSFKYAAIAYQEALLRYPDAPQVTAWQWGLAYSQAQTGSSAAGRAYASLVNLALNEENIPLDSLPVWFHTQEQDLTLALHPLDKPSGAPEYHLLEIQPGDMYLLARVSTGETTISPLFDAFNFEGETSSAFTFDDLTGDGIPELAFYRQEARDTRLHDPLVFDLTGASPAPLPVEQSTPLDIKMGFSVAIECPSCTGPQARVLQLNASIFPACPLSAMRSYQWDGSLFRSQATVFNAHPVVANLAYCETIRTHAADFLPASANLALLQALQPHWPPPLDLGGRLYPADSQAELAYHVGIYQALSGDSIASLETFQALSRQDNSEWSAAAAQFLQQYQNGARLIRACLTAPGCSPSLAIQQVLGNSSSGDLDAALRLLRQSGLDTIANGQFDFNRDEQAEYWFTLRARPGQALEFWILVLTPGGVKPVFVDFVEESKPPIYFSIAFGSDSVFQFEGRQGYALRLTRENQAPYIESFAVEPVLTTYTRDRLAQAESSLFSGTPADTVASQMEEVLDSGRFNCLTGRICDRFDYMLGLAYELSGRDRDAIDTYIKLWWENKSSPFTAMARSKLIFYPPITPGPSPTPTRTITSTPTAGPSPTLGPSPTEEPYPYPEPTEETPYPYP